MMGCYHCLLMWTCNFDERRDLVNSYCVFVLISEKCFGGINRSESLPLFIDIELNVTNSWRHIISCLISWENLPDDPIVKYLCG